VVQICIEEPSRARATEIASKKNVAEMMQKPAEVHLFEIDSPLRLNPKSKIENPK